MTSFILFAVPLGPLGLTRISVARRTVRVLVGGEDEAVADAAICDALGGLVLAELQIVNHFQA